MINTWNESSLHEQLKNIFCNENGRTEVEVQGSICDIVFNDNSIIEIQTKKISALQKKLEKLLVRHRVKVIFPISIETMLYTYDVHNNLKFKRKSPKKGSMYDIFQELFGIWHLIENENLSITILFIKTSEIRTDDGNGSWRRKGISISNRMLDSIESSIELCGIASYAHFIPESVPTIFTTQDLKNIGIKKQANAMVWVLNKLNVIELIDSTQKPYRYKKNYK